MKIKPTETQIQQINGAVGRVNAELNRLRKLCALSSTPLREVTFKVLKNGETRLRIGYRR